MDRWLTGVSVKKNPPLPKGKGAGDSEAMLDRKRKRDQVYDKSKRIRLARQIQLFRI